MAGPQARQSQEPMTPAHPPFPAVKHWNGVLEEGCGDALSWEGSRHSALLL